jgi:hypothetical protein
LRQHGDAARTQSLQAQQRSSRSNTAVTHRPRQRPLEARLETAWGRRPHTKLVGPATKRPLHTKSPHRAITQGPRHRPLEARLETAWGRCPHTKLVGPATSVCLHRKPPRYARDTGPIEARLETAGGRRPHTKLAGPATKRLPAHTAATLRPRHRPLEARWKRHGDAARTQSLQARQQSFRPHTAITPSPRQRPHRGPLETARGRTHTKA